MYKRQGLDYEKIDPTRFGVDISSGIGGINTIEAEYERGREKDVYKRQPQEGLICFAGY